MNRMEAIRGILSVIQFDEQMPDKILWLSEPEGMKDTFTIYFTVGGERRLLMLRGSDYATYLNYRLELYSIVEGRDADFAWFEIPDDGQGWNECQLIHEFEEGTTETEAKEWAEAWLLEYLTGSNRYNM